MHRMWKYKMGHIIFWVATILFHMYTRSNLLESAGIKHFIVEIIIRNGLLALLIYFNLQVLIPHYVRTQRWISYALLLAISLFGYALLKNIHDVYLFGSVLNEVSQMEYFHNTFYNISIALFYVAFSIALELSREWYLQREFIQRIEMEKLNTELEYLKAQINPHFLFNSINTIYFQIDKQNKVARDMVSSFSDMLRYQLYECSGKDIAIEREINYLRHYVDLQRKRMDDNYKIVFNANENATGFSIAPLLLIPFVENAFKHVSHFPFDNKISILLSTSHDMFMMNVINTRDHETGKIDNGGIGLKNVKRRLQLTYNGRHTLDIHERPGSFEINLALKVDRI